MSISIIILSISITSAICTSLIASFLHNKMSWHKSVKKSKWKNVNLFLSSFYQFNNHFYSSFSFLRELMINSFIISLFFKYLICEPNYMSITFIIGSFVVTCVLRMISQAVAYAKFYDEDLVK